MFLSDLFYFAAIAIGPIALAVALIYGITRYRRLTRRERNRREQATRDVYRAEERAEP